MGFLVILVIILYFLVISMNSMSSICSIANTPPQAPVFVTVNNPNFTSPVVADGSQLGITSTTQVTNWTISDINTTNSSLRILNNLSLSDNASPYAYDASANGTTGFIKTVFFVTQSVSPTKTTTLYQTITIPSDGTYKISVCIAPRKTLYNSAQYFGITFNNSNLALTGGVAYKSGDNTLTGFATGASTQSFVRISGTWTGTAGTYTGTNGLLFRWVVEVNADTTIMITGVTIIKQ